MANFPSPIPGLGCVNPTTHLTDAVLTGDAEEDAIEDNTWTLYDLAPDPDDPFLNPGAESTGGLTHTGGVGFGVQCGSLLTIHVDGAISPYSVNAQSITITVDGVEVWEKHIGTFTTGDPYAAVETVDEDIEIELSDTPCGHTVQISATTGDEFGHNHIFWTISASVT